MNHSLLPLVVARQLINNTTLARVFLCLMLLFPAAFRLVAADYFVRNDGDDGASGDSANRAWRTIERVNRARLQPGDRVLFDAAKSFAGNLLLTAEDAGTSNAPVVIGSFGQGRATIQAGRGTGITVQNAGGVVIENLLVAGDGPANTGYGLRCDNTLTNAQRLRNLIIRNVEARGFGIVGILMMPWKLLADPSGYIFTWLVGYSALLGPIGGILIADYFVWRRCRLNLFALYHEEGEYRFTNGFSIAALLALTVAVLPNLPGFLATIKVVPKENVAPLFISLYNYAWFVGFFVAFVVYLVARKLSAAPKAVELSGN